LRFFSFFLSAKKLSEKEGVHFKFVRFGG